MKTRDEIINEWVSDSSVDPEKANDELLRIPALHAKYTRYLSDYRMELKKLNLKIDRVKREKHEYYSGKTPQEKLKADGKKPFKVILNAGVMNMYIDSDDEMQELYAKRAYYDEVVEFCKDIIKEIGNRTWQLREFLTHERYMNGAR